MNNNPSPKVSDEVMEAFRSRFHGRLIMPGDADYDEARGVWNGMIDRRPLLIARCMGVDDVVKVLQFTGEHELEISVRGGGHNVAGSAVCDGGVVIDLTEMNEVQVDPENRTVRVEGGATLGDVDRATQKQGLATALGVVSETGVAGLTLNGGLGHLRRQHGLACDNLISARVVTADGRVLTASTEENEDLFWAIRGGGGNFGIAVSLEYRLHEVGPEVDSLFVFYPAETTEQVRPLLNRFRDWADAAPREASALPFFLHLPEIEEFPEDSWGRPALALLGCYNGDRAEGEATFQPLRELATPIVDFSGRMNYTELQSMLDGDYPEGLRYYWKSVYVDELSSEVIDLIARHGSRSPSRLSTVDLWHLGGAIAEVDPEATAFWHRQRGYMLNFEANWEDPDQDEENVRWVRDGIEAARRIPWVSGGYGNFPGMNDDPVRTVFGDNLKRLIEVKTTYDPDNRFHFNMNIKPRKKPAA